MSALLRRGLGAVVLPLLVGSCAFDDGKSRTYPDNDLVLAVGNAAKSTCTCLFVMEMSDDFCKAWVRASPDVGRFSVDRVNKRVDAWAFVSWSAHARFIDEKRGCLLE